MKGKTKPKHHGAIVTHAVAKGGDGHMKHGGHVKKHKEEHKAHGEKAKHRLDKKARGGKIMTPSSPLSGAEPKAEIAKYKEDKEND